MGEIRPFSSSKSRLWLVIAIIVGALVIDQAIKLYIASHYALGESREIFSWFWLCYIENNGMAFGIQWFSKLALTLFRLLAVGLLGWYIHTLIRKPEIPTGYIATIAFIIAGAAGNDPTLFLKGFEALLSDAEKAKLAQNRQAVEQIVRDILGKGTSNDTGKRMTAVFKILQTKYSIDVPPTISGFQSSQERLTIAMESMLRMMTSAEMARLDVILATAKADGADVPEIGNNVPPEQAFAQKKEAAIAYINAKLEGDLTEDVREKLETLKTKLDEADAHRPLSMMQCMVGVIKQNIVTSLKTLGAGSARTVTNNLTADGIIGGNDNAPGAEPKERRFIEIWP